jgi:hypothetical protein
MGVFLFWERIITDWRTLILHGKVLEVYFFFENQSRFKVVVYSFVVVKF